jgi:hypothetical protein
MQKNFIKYTVCIIILAIVIYLSCALSKPKAVNKPYYMNTAEMNANANAYLNADANTNTNAQRFQKDELVLDRSALVVENTFIIPANELVQMNFKDVNDHPYKEHIEKELYTPDKPLFDQTGKVDLVPLDINDSSHRRVNFY